MRGIKSLASAVAQPAATVSLIPLKTPGDAVTVDEKQPPRDGQACQFIIHRSNADLFSSSSSAIASPLDHRSGFHTPASREREYSPAAGHDASFDASIDLLPEASSFREPRRSQTADHHGPESQQLSPNDMVAPASAVHSMSVNLLGSDDVSRDSGDLGWT